MYNSPVLDVLTSLSGSCRDVPLKNGFLEKMSRWYGSKLPAIECGKVSLYFDNFIAFTIITRTD